MMKPDDEKVSIIPAASGDEETRSSTTGGSKKKRASSLFKSARKSFYRSGGKRGASVEKLRGTSGADFEATGHIRRSNEGIRCGCFGPVFDDSDVFVLIKGPFIFVFASATSTAPKYAISLKQLQAKVNSPEHGRHPVVLETSLGDMQYEISFEKSDEATKFARVVKEQSAVADRAEVKKKLGHDHLVSKRASVAYAEQIANEKCKEAPPKPEVNYDQPDMNYVAGTTVDQPGLNYMAGAPL